MTAYTVTIGNITHRTRDPARVEALTAQAVEDGESYTVTAQKEETAMTAPAHGIDYTVLPKHMRDGARRYIEHGIKPGSFLTAVICNDFTAAFMRADDINRAALPDFGRFFEGEAPDACWGSPEIFNAWVKRGGLEGVAP